MSIACFLLIVLTLSQHQTGETKEESLEFILLHDNDLHTRYEQLWINSTSDGFDVVAYQILKHRNDAHNGKLPVVYLNTGDMYNINQQDSLMNFSNFVQPDAMAFNIAGSGINIALPELKIPILACNLIKSSVSQRKTIPQLKRSVVLLVNRTRVGVIGYVASSTIGLQRSKLKFKSAVKAVNDEATRLKRKGVKIIISLSHSNYREVVEIATNCPEVDVVIGSYTLSALSEGCNGAEYPLVITRKGGKQVPIVQACTYNDFLGKLQLKFDEKGHLLNFTGSPIVFNDFKTRKRREATVRTRIKYTCDKGECNLGNLVTDAMVYYRARQYKNAFWTDAPIAFILTQTLTSVKNNSELPFISANFDKLLPQNENYVFKVPGKTIHDALLHSFKIGGEGFLQISGLQVVYNKKYKRATIFALCSECDIPDYEKLNDTKVYGVILTDRLVKGDYEYAFNVKKEDGIALTDIRAILTEYFKNMNFVYPAIESRVRVVAAVAVVFVVNRYFIIVLILCNVSSVYGRI